MTRKEKNELMKHAPTTDRMAGRWHMRPETRVAMGFSEAAAGWQYSVGEGAVSIANFRYLMANILKAYRSLGLKVRRNGDAQWHIYNAAGQHSSTYNVAVA